MSDTEFVPGLFVKAPRPGAPDFVKSGISIKPAEFHAWLGERLSEEWVNIDVKESKGGKWYAAVDNWKPNTEGSARTPTRAAATSRDESFDDDIGF